MRRRKRVVCPKSDCDFTTKDAETLASHVIEGHAGWTIVIPTTGEHVCIPCELNGWHPCPAHEIKSQPQGLFQVLR